MKYSAHQSSRRFSGKALLITAVCVLFGFVLTGVIATRYWYQQQLRPVSVTTRYETVTVEKGATASEIADLLAEKNLIRSSQAFLWYLRNNNLRDSLQAGQYQLNAADSVPEIANAITEGKVKKDLFTILPGQRVDQIKDQFLKAGFAETAITAALDPNNYKNHPALIAKPTNASLEGYLYPDSYQRTADTTPQQIVEQALDEMANALTPDIIDGFQRQGLGIHQGVILSSIVVKETSSAQAAPTIAGVFLNRLRQGIPLGADPTYQYIADITGQARSAAIDSPYNTRKYAGLPPGPISNVTQAAMQAVAKPQTTDYLFFVAGDDGKIYFSKTQAEHEALTRQHCIKLCSTY